MMWYPSALYTINDFWYKTTETFFHTIPAYLFDFFYSVTGKRARWVYYYINYLNTSHSRRVKCWRLLKYHTQVKMYAKATIAFSSLEFFTTHQWKFISNNPIRLMEEMSTQDKKTFYFDVREIEWKSYFDVFIQGARRFVLKEDPSTLPLARRNLNRYILVINYLQYKNIGAFFNCGLHQIVQALHGKDVSTSTLFLRLIHRVVALFQTVFATRYLSRNCRFLIDRVFICVKV